MRERWSCTKSMPRRKPEPAGTGAEMRWVETFAELDQLPVTLEASVGRVMKPSTRGFAYKQAGHALAHGAERNRSSDSALPGVVAACAALLVTGRARKESCKFRGDEDAYVVVGPHAGAVSGECSVRCSSGVMGSEESTRPPTILIRDWNEKSTDGCDEVFEGQGIVIVARRLRAPKRMVWPSGSRCDGARREPVDRVILSHGPRACSCALRDRLQRVLAPLSVALSRASTRAKIMCIGRVERLTMLVFTVVTVCREWFMRMSERCDRVHHDRQNSWKSGYSQFIARPCRPSCDNSRAQVLNVREKAGRISADRTGRWCRTGCVMLAAGRP